MRELIFILGGARSGKSQYAEKLATELGGENVLYLATAEAKDEEMAARIDRHRSRRPSGWDTLEAPSLITQSIQTKAPRQKTVLVDCISMLVSNIMLTYLLPENKVKNMDEALIESQINQEIQSFLKYVRDHDLHCIMVSNEVGMGLVPEYESGRLYRDILGRVNQMIAGSADKVIFMVSGLPMQVK